VANKFGCIHTSRIDTFPLIFLHSRENKIRCKIAEAIDKHARPESLHLPLLNKNRAMLQKKKKTESLHFNFHTPKGARTSLENHKPRTHAARLFQAGFSARLLNKAVPKADDETC
jgi:hypothetical protein